MGESDGSVMLLNSVLHWSSSLADVHCEKYGNYYSVKYLAYVTLHGSDLVSQLRNVLTIINFML